MTQATSAINDKFYLILQAACLIILAKSRRAGFCFYFKKVKFEADVVKFSDSSNLYRKDWRYELEFKFDRS